MDIITADGGIDVSTDFNKQEKLAKVVFKVLSIF